MVTNRRAILALNLTFLNSLHLSEAVLKCATMFEFRLIVSVNSYGYVGDFYPIFVRVCHYTQNMLEKVTTQVNQKCL